MNDTAPDERQRQAPARHGPRGDAPRRRAVAPARPARQGARSGLAPPWPRRGGRADRLAEHRRRGPRGALPAGQADRRRPWPWRHPARARRRVRCARAAAQRASAARADQQLFRLSGGGPPAPDPSAAGAAAARPGRSPRHRSIRRRKRRSKRSCSRSRTTRCARRCAGSGRRSRRGLVPDHHRKGSTTNGSSVSQREHGSVGAWTVAAPFGRRGRLREQRRQADQDPAHAAGAGARCRGARRRCRSLPQLSERRQGRRGLRAAQGCGHVRAGPRHRARTMPRPRAGIRRPRIGASRGRSETSPGCTRPAAACRRTTPGRWRSTARRPRAARPRPITRWASSSRRVAARRPIPWRRWSTIALRRRRGRSTRSWRWPGCFAPMTATFPGIRRGQPSGTARPSSSSRPRRRSGDAQASERLGDLYLNGRGAPANVDLALAHYEAAARSGRTGAQLKLARLLQEGADGVRRRSREGGRLFPDGGRPGPRRRRLCAGADVRRRRGRAAGWRAGGGTVPRRASSRARRAPMSGSATSTPRAMPSRRTMRRR